MLANYLTAALRHLWRERGYAAINLFGLAVGLALCLLVIQLAAHQLSVGDFHENRGHIYRMLGPRFLDSARYTEALPIELGPTLQAELPEVERAVRFSGGSEKLLRVGTKDGITEEVLTAEAGVFQVFGFPLLRGNPETALERPYTMVLTEPLARRLFGESDPMGQVVRVNEEFDCEVTGIVGQPPPSSLLQFSALLSFATEYKEKPGMMASRSSRAFATFVQLTPGAAPDAVAALVPGVVEGITGVPESLHGTAGPGVSVLMKGMIPPEVIDLPPDASAGDMSVQVETTPAEMSELLRKVPGSEVSMSGEERTPPEAPESLRQTSGVTMSVQGEGQIPPEVLELLGKTPAENLTVRVVRKADPPSAEVMPGIEAGAESSESAVSYVLQPLKSIYFDAEVPNSLGANGNPIYLGVCAILAVVILTIAGVNYVNLATARAGRRIHEIGVRKALGAHRGQLIRQLLTESLLLSVGATVIGAAIAEVAAPVMASAGRFDLTLPYMHWTTPACAGAVALALGIGLAAGAYPAWVVARSQPFAAVRGGSVGGVRFRRGLVVAQFTATAAMMTMSLLIWDQVDFIQSLLRQGSDSEFQPEQVVVIENKALTPDQARIFKTELLRDSRIVTVGFGTTVPGKAFRSEKLVKPEGAGEQVKIRVYDVDGDFVGAMGLRMIRGRGLKADATGEIVINEAAARMLGWTEPVGKTISGFRSVHERRVVGVIEDFHFDGPHRKIEPLLMVPFDQEQWVSVIIVGVRHGHLDDALAAIDDTWSTLAPYRPIQRHSLEEVTANLYSEELMVGRALTAFLFLAIAVAAVGLFGMAAHAAHERTREIGVRKVFGASAAGLTAMMLRDFARPVAIAFVLSVPVAWWLGNQWLHDFAYRVEMGIGLFVVSGALSFLIAGLTVGHQAMRAALTNPVETLRTE